MSQDTVDPGGHLSLYRVGGRQIIEISRMLHDRMDLHRHSPSSEKKGE